MAAFNFPNSPSTNDTHTENGVTYKWNGTVWKRQNASYTDATNLNISGISTFGGVSTFTGDATFSGNVAIGKTLTYEDVKNVDSVGIITARSGINIQGNSTFTGNVLDFGESKQLRFGANNDFAILHNGNTLLENDTAGGILTINNKSTSGTLKLQVSDGEDAFVATPDGKVEIFHDGNAKIETASTGAIVTGIAKAVSDGSAGVVLHRTFSGNVSGATNTPQLDFTLTDTATSNQVVAKISPQALAGTGDAFKGNLRFFTANDAGTSTERLRISSAGHLGVGDDNPDTRLSVKAASGTDVVGKFTSTDANAWIQFRDNSTTDTGVMVGASGDNLLLRAGSNTRVTIDSSGHITPGAAGTQNLGSTSKEFNNLYLGDSGKIYLGSDQDLEVNHNGTDGYVKTTTGDLWLQSTADDIIVRAADNISLQVQGGEYGVEIVGNAGVQLYYDSSTYTGPKLSTTATGITVDGEVAAKQDYPDYQPTLDFNFAAVKKLDSRITYYRTGPASYVDEFGKVVLVGDNIPRFDHDPETRESKGLLIEESKTNLIPNSFDKGTWNSGSGGTLVRNAGIAPDGTMTATKATISSNDIDTSPALGPASAGATTQIAISGSTTYTLSIWAKASTTAQVGNNFKVRWKRITGDGVTSETTFALTADWRRYSTTGTTAANNTTMSCYVGGVSGSEALVWGAQLEVSSFTTSLIPTYGSSVTRGKDVVRVEDQEFVDFYNPLEWTLLTITDVTPASLVASPSSVNDIGFIKTNGNNYIKIRYVTDSTLDDAYIDGYGTSNSSVQFDFGGSHNEVDTSALRNVKTALAAKVNDIALTYNGNTEEVDTSCALPLNVDSFWIGENPKQVYIKRIMYYPKRLPNAQLVTLTS